MRESLGRAVRALSLVATMILVSELILAGVFYFSGAVTPQKTADIVKVLGGKLASPPEEPAVAAAPAEPLEIKSQEQLQAAVAQWEASRKQREEALALERDALRSMKEELERVRAEINQKDAVVRRQTAEFEARKKAQEAAAADEGFKNAVDTYKAMEAKAVADSLYRLEDPVAVRYLEAFKTAFRAEVLSEMKKIDAAQQPAPDQRKPDRVARLVEIMSGGGADAVEGAVASAPR